MPGSLLDRFDELGNQLIERWRRDGSRPEAFPDLAAEALERSQPWQGFDRLALTAEILAAERALPEQINLDSTFGKPPLCVFCSDELYIEMLFWVGPRTTIHQHGFSGAFTVLEGTSFHATYSFTPDRAMVEGAHHAWGQLVLDEPTVLGVGHVEPIPSGPQLIHSVRHLAAPTVSLVVRTHGDEVEGPQLNYFPPGLALDLDRRDPDRTRRIQLLRLLFQTDRAVALDALRTRSARCSELERLELLRTLENELQSQDAAEAFFDGFPASTREPANQLLDELHRSIELTARAHTVRNPDHALLLGLLEVLVDRDRIDGWLRRHRPERTPSQWLARWLAEMSSDRTLGMTLDPIALASLPTLLERDALAASGSTGMAARLRDQVGRLAETFRATPLWGPLFR